MFGNIKVRLTLWYILITALFIAFFGATAYLLLRDSISGQTVAPWDIRVAKTGSRVVGRYSIALFVVLEAALKAVAGRY
jgi:hypothetical protein